MKNKQQKDFTDQFLFFSVHDDEWKKLSKEEKKLLNQFRSIEFYPNGLRNGKKFNKAKEFLRVVREMNKIRYENNDKESNIECAHIDQLTELLKRMMLSDIRRLKLDKLLLKFRHEQ